MKNWKQRCCLLCTIGALLSAQGCILLAGAVVGGGSMAYALGRLQYNIDAEVEEVHKAALKALKRLDIFVVSEEIAPSVSKINGQMVDGKEVKIRVEPLTERASKIEIRVGVIGDEERSYMILGAIQKQL